MGRVSRLDNVKRTSSSKNRYTESKQQASTHELANSATTRLCSSLNDDTCAGDSTTDHHSVSATPGVASGSDERQSADTTNLVHGGNNTSPSTRAFYTVVLLESVIGEEGVEHRAVETVGRRAHEADKGTDVKDERVPGEEGDWLLDFGLCECLGSRDDLDLSNSALEVLQVCQRDLQLQIKILTPLSELACWTISWVVSLVSAIVAVLLEARAAADGCKRATSTDY